MKKIWTALLLLMLSVFLALPAAAEEVAGKKDWQVSFTTEEKMVSNFKTSEMDDVIYAMEPGDSVTFSLSLTNSYRQSTDWYMENEVLHSLENSQAVANGGAYTYRLVYTNPAGTDKVLYDSERVGGSSQTADSGIIAGNGDEGLHQATSSLEKYFYLDTLATNQTGKITLLVELEGESLVNTYQDTLARLQMNFAVELTDKPGKPTTSVQTGDYSNTLLWSTLALISGLCCMGLLAWELTHKDRYYRGRWMSLLLVVGLLSLSVPNAQAANEASYDYTITIYSGKSGSFSGVDKQVFRAGYGDTINFNAVARTTVNNPNKYYVRGLKKGGQDNNQKLSLSSISVTEDADYVVAYGVIGSMVGYTIEYVDVNGNVLAPSETYYGNVGDKPVVAYLYMDGYQPQAQNLTRTLTADESENIFRFVYTPLTTGQTGGGTAGGAAGNNGGAVGGNAGNNNAGGGQNNNDAVVIQPGADAQTPPEDNNALQPDNPVETPRELIDLDNADVPLANVELEDTSGLHSTNKMPMIFGAGLATLAAVGVGGLLWLLRQKKDEGDERA